MPFLWTPLAGMLHQLEEIGRQEEWGKWARGAAAADGRVVNVVIIVAEGQRRRSLVAVGIFWGWAGASCTERKNHG